MLTPAFELCQDENFVTVVIKTPYVKISEVDFVIDGHGFKFFVKPYFLRLKLPGKVVEDGREGASYDVEKGTFTVKLPKLHQGEDFEGLDLLTSLLAPANKNKINQPLIEVISGDSVESDVHNDSSDEFNDSNAEFNWEIEQDISEDIVSMKLESEEGKYGFANKKAGIFNKRQEELYEIADVPDPESTTLTERRLARLAAEDIKFDPDHYLADLFNEDIIQLYLDYCPPWDEEYKNLKKHIEKQTKEEPSQSSNGCSEEVHQGNTLSVIFTEKEKDKLRHLPNKEYLLDEQVELSLLLGLVDIIFAYTYNYRTTEGENTVESAWTINKLSSTLCYFETFTNINDVIIACCRRCLGYPIYRHWNLVQCVLEDTKMIFALGRRRLLKCLLEIHELFNEDDPRFILNDLYITDYCVWIQKTSDKKLHSLNKILRKVELRKIDIGWQLEDLEKAAKQVAEEEIAPSEDDTTDSSDSEETSTDSDEESEEQELAIKIGNLSLSTENESRKPDSSGSKIIVLNSTTTS